MSFQDVKMQALIGVGLVGVAFGLGGCTPTNEEVSKFYADQDKKLATAPTLTRDLNLHFYSRSSDLNEAVYLARSRESGEIFRVALNRTVTDENSLANQIDDAIQDKNLRAQSVFFFDSDHLIPMEVTFKNFPVIQGYGFSDRWSYYQVDKIQFKR